MSMQQIMFASLASGGDFVINGSGLFGGTTSDFLDGYVPSTPTDNNVWTYEAVVKLSAIGTIMSLLDSTTSDTVQAYIRINSNGLIRVFDYNSGTNHDINSYAELRDPSAYYSIVVAFDSGEASATDRVKIWINGTAQATQGDAPSLNAASYINTSGREMNIGNNTGGSVDSMFDGYFARATFIDGQALDPTSFGEITDEGFYQLNDVNDLNFGNNGFLLTGGSAISAGTDSSGNDNDFSKAGSIISTSDSPTNDAANDYSNYAVIDPLNKRLAAGGYAASNTLSNGNRTTASDVASSYQACTQQLQPGSKYHFEITTGTWGGGGDTSQSIMTLVPLSVWQSTTMPTTAAGAYQLIIKKSGSAGFGTKTRLGGSLLTTLAVDIADGDRMSFDIDMSTIGSTDAIIKVNGTSRATDSSMVLLDEPYLLVYDVDTAARSTDFTYNFGSDAFTDTPATDHVALGTATQSTPAIINPADHFHSQVVTHNGTSTASTCTFNLDTYEWLAFIKNTTGANEKWYVMDSLKGTGHYWSTNDTTTPEQSDSNVMSVSGTGFTLLSTLGAKEYLVEFHKLGLAADTASNTSGSINSTATSSNILSGAFVSRYTGTGSNATIGHGLPVAPDFISCKNLVSAGHNDNVYHSSIGATKYLSLYNTNAAGTASTIWNDTEPTTSVFSVGTGSTTNGSVAMVAIGWAGVDGFSKFGLFEGNGNVDGSFQNTGFGANAIFAKNIDAALNWVVHSRAVFPNNLVSQAMYYDLPNILASNNSCDIVSNGIKRRVVDTGANGAATYIYGAWGGQPMTDGSVNQGRAR